MSHHLASWLAEVGPVEDFLQAEDLDAFLACFLYIRKVLLLHRLADLGDGGVRVVDRIRHLDEAADDFSHQVPRRSLTPGLRPGLENLPTRDDDFFVGIELDR